MIDQFNIYVEVDKVRADAAYLKGMRELAEIWPQIKANDAARSKKAFESIADRLPLSDAHYFSLQNHYLPTATALETLVKISKASSGPYRMTVEQVSQMLSWESGRSIESIKEQLASELLCP